MSTLLYTSWLEEAICVNGEGEKNIEWENRMVLPIEYAYCAPSRRDRTIRATGRAGATLSGPAFEGRWLLPCLEVGANKKRKSKQPVSRDAHDFSIDTSSQFGLAHCCWSTIERFRFSIQVYLVT